MILTQQQYLVTALQLLQLITSRIKRTVSQWSEPISCSLILGKPRFGEFCLMMMGSANIERSKSDISLNAWPLNLLLLFAYSTLCTLLGLLAEFIEMLMLCDEVQTLLSITGERTVWAGRCWNDALQTALQRMLIRHLSSASTNIYSERIPPSLLHNDVTSLFH